MVRVKARQWFAGAAIGVALGVGAYAAGSAISGNESTPAAADVARLPNAPPTGTAPGPDVTPLPGSTPDTSQPFWYVPYLNQSYKTPLFDGTIAGVHIASGGDYGLPCDTNVTPVEGAAGLTAVAGTPFSLTSSFRPDGIASPDRIIVGLCRGRPVSAEATYPVTSDPATMRYGGTILVFRHAGLPVAGLSIPRDRWSAGAIAGRPAAIARPILPDIGLGDSAVVVLDGGVVTIVSASGIPQAQVEKFAAGLFQ